MKTAEQKENKKRKGISKDGNNKPKKPKKEEKKGCLTLNAAATTVEILHFKVMDLCILFCLPCVRRGINFNIPNHRYGYRYGLK